MIKLELFSGVFNASCNVNGRPVQNRKSHADIQPVIMDPSPVLLPLVPCRSWEFILKSGKTSYLMMTALALGNPMTEGLQYSFSLAHENMSCAFSERTET
jgi:hypothetical protein